MKSYFWGAGLLIVCAAALALEVWLGLYLHALQTFAIGGLLISCMGLKYALKAALIFYTKVTTRSGQIAYRNHRLHRRVVKQMALIEEQRLRLAELEVSDDEVSHYLAPYGNFGSNLYELWTAASTDEEKAFVKSHPLWKYAQANAVIEIRKEKNVRAQENLG